jgi:hypothetical protein
MNLGIVSKCLVQISLSSTWKARQKSSGFSSIFIFVIEASIVAAPNIINSDFQHMKFFKKSESGEESKETLNLHLL